ncbi:glutamate--tRNA ligase [Methanothermobacter tenebrarum]|uniref:Glutamate--tRNA ligase n=1 Tax=Methanothermobacter tenebrarum TaxID=680118 RepID=A0A328PF32_9EURY|nr:glutamate--tRNA ligase [Methanothermobacter tenebrarum]NPV64293.1 glutamate--tRNA ligase [Methanobacteriaceae archaeon]RAO79901.1 glutamate--tRNA ligase [Methanothermobacter tenebrarum]
MNLEKIIYKYALINAVKHKGKAMEKAVIGAIMSNEPQFRKKPQKVLQKTKNIVEKVNKLTPKEQKKELKKLGIKLKEKKEAEKKKKLPPLPNIQEKVILRFAPNPSGPLHIGHARAAILNHEYAKKYKGKLILRMEDTDPRRVDPKAYKMIQEDLKWLGIKWDQLIIQSDRIPTYYKHATKLLEKGGGYICTCKPTEFKKLKDQSKPCPCRNLPTKENLKRWEKMQKMPEGKAVLRVKTDLKHKNPAIRDWVALRIVDEPHPRTGKKYRIYPTMNFAVTIDDHLLGITHVLRGKDHITNTEKQEYLYKHLGWKPPTFIHYGRLHMENIQLSTSKTKEGIQKGKYKGWDDPRLGTIRAIKRRGIQAQAIREAMIEIGAKIADSTLTWKKIYGLNKNILEEIANRYFFVAEPQPFKIKNLPEHLKGTIERPLHPDHPERGQRKIPFNGRVYIQKDDLKKAKILRLVDAVNVKIKNNSLEYHSMSLEEARKHNAKIIHWVPMDENIPANVIMPNTKIVEGLLEPAAKSLKIDQIVQLERFGFARVDKTNKKTTFYYTHK